MKFSTVLAAATLVLLPVTFWRHHDAAWPGPADVLSELAGLAFWPLVVVAALIFISALMRLKHEETHNAAFVDFLLTLPSIFIGAVRAWFIIRHWA